MSSYYAGEELEKLPGKTVKQIFFNKQGLKFVTDEGDIAFGVYGDCCSQSEFWDFYGVKNLIGSKVISIDDVELDPATGSRRPDEAGEDTQYYGYKIVAEHPEWGEVTSVFSFRNMSNGYYGGSLNTGIPSDINHQEIFDDVIEAAD